VKNKWKNNKYIRIKWVNRSCNKDTRNMG